MPFTEDDLKKQDRQVTELREELSRLNSLFDQRMKEAGASEAELKTLDADQQPPEVKRALEEVRAEARREGERRRAQAQPPAAPTGRPAGQRPGAIKL